MECLLNIQSIALPGLVLLHPVVYTLPPFPFSFPLPLPRGKKSFLTLDRRGSALWFPDLLSNCCSRDPRSWGVAGYGYGSSSSFVIELVSPRRVITRDGGSSNLTCEVSLLLFPGGTRGILSSRFEFTRYTNEVTYNIRADFQINVSPSIIKSWH